MKRRDFFKKLGIGAAVAIATPEILANIKTPENEVGYTMYIKEKNGDWKPITHGRTQTIEVWNLTTSGDFTNIF